MSSCTEQSAAADALQRPLRARFRARLSFRVRRRGIHGYDFYQEVVMSVYISPFAPSGSHCLNFKLSVQSSPQSQPVQDVLL